MLTNWMHCDLARAHQRDMLRAAETDRLLRRAVASRKEQHSSTGRAPAGMGR